MGWKSLANKSSLLLLSIMLSGCASDYVLNTEKEGPYFVIANDPVPEPDPAPPTPEPVVETPTVAQLNEKAVAAFDDLGFEAQVSDKGVVVYLPPSIYFKGSEFAISLPARTKIAEIAKEVQQPYLSDRIIEVSGHTDSLGEASLNLDLSKKRSLAATEELVFSGVSKTRISSLWYGEAKPRLPEFNEDGSLNIEHRNLNRRVDFTILNPL